MPSDLSPQDHEQILAAVRAGHKINAIKLYREATGAGLKEAKDAVEALETETAEPPGDLIAAELFAGRKIQAIKLYREAMGVDLKTAKDAIDAMEQQLRRESPSRFTAAPGRGCGSNVLLLLFVLAMLGCMLV